MMKVGEYFAKLCKRVRNPQNFINMTIQQVVKIFKVGIKEKSIYLSIKMGIVHLAVVLSRIFILYNYFKK